MPEFSLRIDQNKYLASGASEVDAIVSVEASGSGGGAVTSTAGAVEVIIIDTSDSMKWPQDKIMQAKVAAATAVDVVRDGVRFAVVAGSHQARMVYPPDPVTAVATPETRAQAKAALRALGPRGGTAIGTWLRLADTLFAPHPGAVKHAILLTDGNNEHEAPEVLDATLAAVAGHFVCDCRGVGTDWVVAELRKVASAMLGTVDIIADPAGLVGDFTAMAEKAMGKALAELTLRLWVPQGAQVKFVKQVLPTVEDLTGRRTAVSAQIGDYPTGSWGDESRDYHVCVQVPPGQVGQEMRAGWVRLVGGVGPDGQPQVLGSANVLAEWTDDETEYTKINPVVANYTGQAELAAVIQEGLQARQEGDVDRATTRLGRAVQLAKETGNEAIAGMLGNVVDVVDEGSGTVRLKRDVDKAAEMELDTRSTRTVRTRKE